MSVGVPDLERPCHGSFWLGLFLTRKLLLSPLYHLRAGWVLVLFQILAINQQSRIKVCSSDLPYSLDNPLHHGL
jgi:hypothetical protein